VGAILGSPLLDMFGRKGTIILSTLPMIGGFWLIFLAGGDEGVVELLVGRVLTGVSVGLTSVAVPTYISETAPAHIRGGLGSVFQLGVVLGVMEAYVSDASQPPCLSRLRAVACHG
jgi:MFS family permease